MICKKLLVAAAVFAFGAFAFGAIQPQDKEKPATRPAEPEKTKVEAPFYGNEKCPVTGKNVNRAKAKEVAGQIVYFCCDQCVKATKADDKEVALKAYPADKVVDLKNTVCPLMSDAIGDSKEKATIMGRTIRMCCDTCVEDGLAMPVVTLARTLNPKIVDLENKKCPVSDHDISKTDVVIVNNTLVRLCCGDCVDAFKKEPEKMLKAAEDAKKKKEKERKEKKDKEKKEKEMK